MELEKLIMDTLSLLEIKVEPIKEFTGVQLILGSHTLNLEKVPTEEAVSISLNFCQYKDFDNLQKCFEILLNVHAYGLLTKGAFFSADSDNDLIIFHKIIDLENLQPEKLAKLIEEFYDTFVLLKRSWDDGEFDFLAKTVPVLNDTPDSSMGIRV